MAADDNDTRRRMQVKSFTTWINLHLGKVGDKVDDVKTDFQDGIRLLKLVEVISEDSLGKYNRKPISKFQKVENLNIPLKYINGFIKDQGISNQYSAENILEENEMLILGMVWSLILRFAVQEISEGDRTAKEGLLLWAQKKVEEGSRGRVKVNNFHTSWQDGMAFCSLIQAYRPDLIDYQAIRPGDKAANLNLAFNTASDALGIPKLLDAADMTSSSRPDEKSVMTYVSFFWKEFASTKKKAMAAERVSKVVAREAHYRELQAAYVEKASALAAWVRETTASFGTLPSLQDATQLQETLDAYVEYSRTARPAKIAELMEVEGLYASISSRLAALGGRTYDAPEACALPSLQRWWEELTMAEQQYEEGIKAALSGAKRCTALVKIFRDKCAKLDGWLAAKAAWVQASHEPCLEVLGKRAPPAPVAALSFSDSNALPVARSPAGRPPSKTAAGADEFGKLPDPTLAAGAEELSPNARSTSMPMRSRAVSMPPMPRAAAPVTPKSKDDSELGSNGRKRKDSFLDNFGSLFGNLFQDKGADDDEPPLPKPVDAIAEEGGPDSAALEPPMSPTIKSAQVLKSRRSHLLFSTELREQKGRQEQEGLAQLESIAPVRARLNLLKAFEEEQASRQLSLANVAKLYEQLETLGCPKLETFAARKDDLSAALAALAAAAADYRADLEAVLRGLEELDEKRLDFAKRAEALHRRIEESTDALSEVMAIERAAEADAIEAELAGVSAEHKTYADECAALVALGEELGQKGFNP